ncbi:MAG: ATP-dependent zinc metalloprotease FtsH [Planctomycetes bacterium ADurb.Bin412]|nr:MAG: ATP-dependent zinc metalloprotease FtsH [Planctomycetes bacterium ADurb.Bin412]
MYGKTYSDKTAELIDAEIKNIMDQAYAEVKDLLDKNRDKVDNLKDALMKYETLDGEEVKLIIAGQKIDKPTVGELLEAEKKNPAPKTVTRKKKQPGPLAENPSDPLPKPDPGFSG